MRITRLWPCVLLMLLGLVASWHRSQPAQAQTWPQIALSSPISGFTNPVHITHAGDGSGRLFVTESGGRIRIVKNGSVLATPFLDISAKVSQGLFSVAFPPGYASKGHFYVNYVDQALNVVVARYRVSTNPDVADANSEQIVLSVASPWADSMYKTAGHAGGELAFSPRDGYLYVGIGDGDPGNRDDTTLVGDSLNLAQNPSSLRGKILRLDVETGNPATYTVPASNPFVGQSGYRPEIWALGVRNPWRSSFDRQTGDFYIGDVGQDKYEEVNYQAGNSVGGLNYGWRLMEGAHCYNPPDCDPTGLTPPVWEYIHDANHSDCSVSGGRVYRGTSYPRMQGIYFYGDYCSGKIWGLRQVDGVWQNALLLNPAVSNYGLISFGEDEAGNLYVTDSKSNAAGVIYMITDSVANAPPVANGQTVTTNEDTAVAVTLSATDPEGDALTYSVVTGPARGALSGTTPNLTYTPNANFNGTDSFTFKANDGQAESNVATVNITINPVNDAPVASNNGYAVSEDQTLTIAAPGVLGNDTDADGDGLTAVLSSGPSSGNLTLNSNGSFVYTPNANFNGSDAFSYKAYDGQLSSSNAVVNITITSVNDPPVANGQSVATNEDASRSITLAASDVDSTTLTYSIVTGPTRGTLSGTAPNLTYTPNANYNGTDSFTFRASDGQSNSNTATVSITIHPVNDAPRATNDTATTKRNKAVNIAVLANDTDVDGNALQVTSVTQPTSGTVVINADKTTVTYTPSRNFIGTATFNYTVSDGQGGSASATVTVTVRK